MKKSFRNALTKFFFNLQTREIKIIFIQEWRAHMRMHITKKYPYFKCNLEGLTIYR